MAAGSDPPLAAPLKRSGRWYAQRMCSALALAAHVLRIATAHSPSRLRTELPRLHAVGTTPTSGIEPDQSACVMALHAQAPRGLTVSLRRTYSDIPGVRQEFYHYFFGQASISVLMSLTCLSDVAAKPVYRRLHSSSTAPTATARSTAASLEALAS